MKGPLPPMEGDQQVVLSGEKICVKIGGSFHELCVTEALAIAGQIIAACEVVLER